jgi:hypothetical protein
MSVSTTIDTSKSLAELTGIDWGIAPADTGTLVRERHEIPAPRYAIYRTPQFAPGRNPRVSWVGSQSLGP